MGKTQMAAGKQVRGSLKVLRIDIPSDNGTVDMKELLPDQWKTLTTDNFAFSTCMAAISSMEVTAGFFRHYLSTTLSYNAEDGILTIDGVHSTSISMSRGSINFWNYRDIVCYYV